jgi:hypothetical protein
MRHPANAFSHPICLLSRAGKPKVLQLRLRGVHAARSARGIGRALQTQAWREGSEWERVLRSFPAKMPERNRLDPAP